VTTTDPPARPADASRRAVSPVYVIIGVLVVALVVVGFILSATTVRYASRSYAPPASPAAADAAREGGGARQADFRAAAEAVAAARAVAAPPAGPPKVEPVDRKIVYTGHLDLVVKNLDAAEKQADELLSAAGGRLISSESRGDAGSKRTAAFRLEVPVAKFRELVAGLRKLGIPERDKVESSDLTAEYVDIQARVKNMKAEEDNLLKLLAERARSVEESLAIRRQIQPLRE
jgi:hypothetical protein